MDCTSPLEPGTRMTLQDLAEQPFETQCLLVKHHLELSLLLVNQLLEEEVYQLAGKRYERHARYSRWGTNPSTLQIGKEKLQLRIPRVLDKQERKTVSLERPKHLKEVESPDASVLRSMLLGLSTRDHKSVCKTVATSLGLSKSAISRTFVEESAEALKAFQTRPLGTETYVALLIDGKYMVDEQIVIVMGITAQGEKKLLDFIETTTENHRSIGELLRNLIARGLEYDEGLLCVLDGGKGLKKAVQEVFGKKALIQRCQWHKRENIVGYLSKENQEKYRRKLTSAYRKEAYAEAKAELEKIHSELEEININAAASLEEGLEETLTIHKLGVVKELGRTLSTTNCIENVNGLVGKYTDKVKYWRNSQQKQRWIGTALLEIEGRMRKVPNYKKIPLLEKALQEYVVKIE